MRTPRGGRPFGQPGGAIGRGNELVEADKRGGRTELRKRLYSSGLKRQFTSKKLKG